MKVHTRARDRTPQSSVRAKPIAGVIMFDLRLREIVILARSAAGLFPLVVLLAACAASRVPATTFAEPLEIERAIMRYYEYNATEENRTCLSPYIDGLTQAEVVEETPERLVVDARYFYRDRFKDDRGDGLGRDCTGYAGRRFTLAKTDAGVAVVEMTGP